MSHQRYKKIAKSSPQKLDALYKTMFLFIN